MKNGKKWIIIGVVVMIMMSSMVFATVTRSQPGNGNTVTYTTDALTGSYTKAYWAVNENVAACDVTGAVCSVTNADCSYNNGAIRVISYTPDGGGPLPTSVMVIVSGTGLCPLNSGQYVESLPGNLGSATSLTGSVSLDFSGGSCNGQSDIDCDGTIGLQEILDTIANIYGDTTYFGPGTFSTSNVGVPITGYYGATIS